MPKQVMLWILSLVNLDEFGQNMIEYASTNLICFYILFIVVILILVCIIYLIYRKIHKKKVDVIAYISFLIAVLSCSAIYVLMDSYNSMCRDYYEEAAGLCKIDRYQDAKVLYQKISNYRNSQEKIAECDYQSSQYCFQTDEYAEAYSFLFPWLANPNETGEIAILGDMRHLLTERVEQISAYCEESGIFQDCAWMLGKWSDEMGNYWLFRMDDNAKTYFLNLNIDSTSQLYEPLSYNNGVCMIKDKVDGDWTYAIIFCPISNNSAYVYNIFSGQMFLFNRE